MTPNLLCQEKASEDPTLSCPLSPPKSCQFSLAKKVMRKKTERQSDLEVQRLQHAEKRQRDSQKSKQEITPKPPDSDKTYRPQKLDLVLAFSSSITHGGNPRVSRARVLRMTRGSCRLGVGAEGGLGSETSREARGTREGDGTAGSMPCAGHRCEEVPALPHTHWASMGLATPLSRTPPSAQTLGRRCSLHWYWCLESS